MRLLSLNTWGGRAGRIIVDFIAEKKNEIDLFCLQEVFHGGRIEQAEMDEHIPGKRYELFSELQEALLDHHGYFQPSLGSWYGLATFVRKNLAVTNERFLFVHGEPYIVPKDDLGHHSRIIHDLTLNVEGRELHVINFHGLWNGKGKTDSDARIRQSHEILKYLKTLNGRIILCGDFNLLPDTQSISLIESFGLKNLITDFDIKTTRTERYAKMDKYADYIFIDSGIRVNAFNVLPDNVSDHAALFLDFDLT